MSDGSAKRVVDPMHNDSGEDSILWMLSEFYSPRMRAVAVFIWVIGLAFLILAIYSAVRFFRVTDTKHEVLFATIFICCFNGIGLMKVFAWQMIHRNSIKREIKRLELRLAELAGALGKNT